MAAASNPITLILATKNAHKVRELRELLKYLPVLTLTGDDVSNFPEVVEDGATFKENALKKANAIAGTTGEAALADDSGLEVDALNGAPGVCSARYAGVGATDQENTAKLLKLMQDIPPDNRGGQFRCVMALVIPGKKPVVVDEKCRGVITSAPEGEQGFGYDPVFYYPDYAKTFAQVDMALKNKVSHRGKALRGIKEKLQMILARDSIL